MKKVFICSRYRADAAHTAEEAVSSALYACTLAIDGGHVPIAPHVYLTRCLDYGDTIEYAQAVVIGRELLAMCDEVWQWGKTVTEGMAELLAYAKELGIPIKVYNTIGIPYEHWNSVKFADSPEFLEEIGEVKS